MSDQTLRDALAIAMHDKECPHRNCAPETMGPYYREIDKILAAHPAEPAPAVTDDAVDFLGRWRWGDLYDRESAHQHEQSQAFARQAIEGLTPLLGPKPLLDRDAVRAVLDRRLHGEQVVDLLMELARPMPTREQIEAAVRKTIFKHFGTYTTAVRLITDDVHTLLNGSES